MGGISGWANDPARREEFEAGFAAGAVAAKEGRLEGLRTQEEFRAAVAEAWAESRQELASASDRLGRGA